MPRKTSLYLKNVNQEDMLDDNMTYRAHVRVHDQIEEINKKIKMEREASSAIKAY